MSIGSPTGIGRPFLFFLFFGRGTPVVGGCSKGNVVLVSLTLGGCSLLAPGGIAKGKLRPIPSEATELPRVFDKVRVVGYPIGRGPRFFSLPRFVSSYFLFVSFFLLFFSFNFFCLFFPVFLFLPFVFAQVPRLLARTKITGHPGETEQPSSGVLFRILVTLRGWLPSWQDVFKQQFGLA